MPSDVEEVVETPAQTVEVPEEIDDDTQVYETQSDTSALIKQILGDDYDTKTEYSMDQVQALSAAETIVKRSKLFKYPKMREFYESFKKKMISLDRKSRKEACKMFSDVASTQMGLSPADELRGRQ